ncbi:MAG: hypothetical protein KGI71_05530, partial [Patescibacteria group bacterium]|nr:hypothetical protein [Patescibacteria group bacterium]
DGTSWLFALVIAGLGAIALFLTVAVAPKPSVAPAIVVRGDVRCWDFGTETIHANGVVTLSAERTLRIDEPQGTTLWVTSGCLVEQKKK